MNTNFTYHRTVHLSDTDAAGVIYFATVLSLCHEAYEASLERAGINLKAFFRNSEAAIPIVHGEVDFFRAIFCGDKLNIQLTPQQLSENEFEIAYQILAAKSAECLAQAKTRHVCINPSTRQRTPLSQSIQDWLNLNH